MSGVGIFLGCICLFLWTLLVSAVWYAIGDKFGRRSSDREVARRVLLSNELKDGVKVEVLCLINDNIYWDEEKVRTAEKEYLYGDNGHNGH